MNEETKRIECKSCKKLLFKTKKYATIKGVEIVIKCRGCKKLNKYVI